MTKNKDRGGSRIFIRGGGGAKMCPHAHYERETRSPLSAGVQAPAWMEAPGFMNALLRYLSLILKHFLDTN